MKKIKLTHGQNELFKCDCPGACGFMEISQDEDGEVYILGLNGPRTFWQRLKNAFSDESYVFEFVLYKKQIKKLKKLVKTLKE